VGYTVGGGYAVEWKGFAYGCVKAKIVGRGWTHWYKLPFIQYEGSNLEATPPNIDLTLGNRLLKRGMSGVDVKALQELLLQLGYVLPKYGADGEYGEEAEAAVKAFQTSEGLEVDGKYGDKTHAALMAAVADDDEGKRDEPVEEETPIPAPEPGTGVRHVVIVSDGGKVNIRVGNGVNYARITTVAPGATFEYIATALNGWNAIVINGQVGWVSAKYSKIA
jgi:peptidoglycan hydrolase-like protein with peptidoglycan-binding domain